MSTERVPPGGWDRAVELDPRPELAYAGWWSRVGAALIDLAVLLVPSAAIAAGLWAGAVAAFGLDSGGGLLAFLLALFALAIVFFIVALLYAPLLMMRQGERNGQTLGKQLVGIRVMRVSGAPMDFAWSALREALVKGLGLGIASTIIPFVPYLLDALWPIWDDQNRALHDMLVDTRVVAA